MIAPAALVLADLLASPPMMSATRVSEPPKIDGRLDDAVWSLAQPVSAFTQKFPGEGKPPSDPTTIRVLYDDEAIYIGFECPQRSAPIVERLTRRDRTVESDRVSVSLGSRADRKTAYEFSINASGSLVDALRFDDTEVSTDWDENWDARTARTDQGWSAELAIPLRILRFDPASAQSWDFQARRYISELQETDEWAYIPRSEAGEVSRYGRLAGLEGLSAGAPLELRPFMVGRVRRLDPGSTGLTSGTDLAGSGGLDLKWHPTRSLVLDATFNPDFGQVEADEVVLNLGTFETYYPEKRPFFLEGLDLFSTPRQLLYTRRIGRAAPTPALRSDAPFGERLVDFPPPSTIYGASKLTGALGDKWQIATLQALTGRSDVDVQLADGTRARRLVDPLTAFDVLRLKRELPGNGYVGMMMTATTHAEPTSEYPRSAPGSILCPNGVVTSSSGRCFNDAYVASLDWKWRSKDGDWVTGGQLIGSTLRDGPPRVVRDGTVIRSGDVGAGALAYLHKEGGKHWVGEVDLEYEGRKLDYNDLGYNQRANDYRWWAAAEYRELERSGPLLESHAKLGTFGRRNLDGVPIGGGYQAVAFGKLSNHWFAYTELHWRPTWFDDREVGDGTALEHAALVGYEIGVDSDPTRRVSFRTWTRTQLLSDGFVQRGDASLLVRVLPQFDFEVLPTWVYTRGEPRFTGRGAADGQYLFGRLEAKSIGAVLRATYTFTPRLTLQTFGQLFLASGHYSSPSSVQTDPAAPRPVVHLSELRPLAAAPTTNPDFQEGSLNVSVVLRWEYSLGSTLYLVYTRSQSPAVTLGSGEDPHLSFTSVRRAPAADVFLAKLTYWWPSR